MNCLPYDWVDGWGNVFFNVTCENQKRADERIPILLKLPFKHKGIMCAPFIGFSVNNVEADCFSMDAVSVENAQNDYYDMYIRDIKLLEKMLI